MKALDGAIEVMHDEFYDKLRWYDNVLDLWGYIWESAIRLAQHNTQVVAYEAHPDNYHYLQKNCQPYSNIIFYNNAVVWSNQTTMTFYGGAFNMGAGKALCWNDSVPSTTVSCVNILDILRQYQFDAIKMDIEWSEYECMQVIMHHGVDLFRKLKAWFIEFHFYEENQNIEQAKRIITWIETLWYHTDLTDVLKNTSIKSIDTNHKVVLLHFFI